MCYFFVFGYLLFFSRFFFFGREILGGFGVFAIFFFLSDSSSEELYVYSLTIYSSTLYAGSKVVLVTPLF